MKTLRRIIMIISIISLIISATILVIEWKKDSEIWHSIKNALVAKNF